MVGRNSIIDGIKLVVFGKSLQGRNIQGGFENVFKKILLEVNALKLKVRLG